MSQHGYMRHMTTPPLVLEIGQKLWQYCQFLSTVTGSLSRTVSELSQLIVQILHQPIHFDSKFQVERVVPQQSFLHGQLGQ